MNKLALASLITAILAAPAIASTNKQTAITDDTQVDTQEPMTNNDFATLDTNEDGFISQGEADNDDVWNYFVKVDQDSDGQLNPEEFEVYTNTYAGTGISQENETAVEATESANDLAKAATTKTKQKVAEVSDTVAAQTEEDTQKAVNGKDVDAQIKAETEDPLTSDSTNIAGENRYSVRETAAKKAEEVKAHQPKVSSQLSAKGESQPVKEMESATDTSAQVEQQESAMTRSQTSATVDTETEDSDSVDTEVVIHGEGAIDSTAKVEHKADPAPEKSDPQSSEQPIPAEDYPYVEDEELATTEPQETHPTGFDEQDSSKVTTDQPQQATSGQNNSDSVSQSPTVAPTPTKFADLDTDSDGYISQEEAQAMQMESSFAEADTNMDERISQAEYDSFTSGKPNTH